MIFTRNKIHIIRERERGDREGNGRRWGEEREILGKRGYETTSTKHLTWEKKSCYQFQETRIFVWSCTVTSSFPSFIK